MIRTQTPVSKIVSTIKSLGWAILGLRYAFVSPSELRALWQQDDAPSLPKLFLGSVTAFLLLINVLGESGVYNSLLGVPESPGAQGSGATTGGETEPDIFVPNTQDGAADAPVTPSAPEASVSPSREDALPPDQALPLEEPILMEPVVIVEGPVGVPGKIWAYTQDFIFTAFIMSLYPCLVLFLSVPIILLVAPRTGDGTDGERFEDALNYTFFQTLNLLVIWALLAAGVSIAWQFIVSIRNVFGFFDAWLTDAFPFLNVVVDFPSTIELLLASVDIWSTAPVLIVLLSCMAVFSALIMLSWHVMGPLRFLSPVTSCFFVGFFLVPFYPLTFFPYLRHVWRAALWVFAAFLISLWAPITLATLVLLVFKLTVGFVEARLGRSGRD